MRPQKIFFLIKEILKFYEKFNTQLYPNNFDTEDNIIVSLHIIVLNNLFHLYKPGIWPGVSTENR